MSNVTLYFALCEELVDRPLSRALRDRAAALSFGEGGFAYAATEEGEKPRFSVPADAFFNVTHTKNLFLCAVSDGEVGLDAEDVSSPHKEREALLQRVFSEEERQTVAAAKEEERTRTFLRLWTEKEASAKFSGGGLKDVLGKRTEGAVLTDLTPLMESLGISAVVTLATKDVPRVTVCELEEE